MSDQVAKKLPDVNETSINLLKASDYEPDRQAMVLSQLTQAMKNGEFTPSKELLEVV
jgi:hypothetical protein